MRMQEILHEVRPALIIETGTNTGGSALWLSVLLEAVRPSAKIVTIDPTHIELDKLPKKIESLRKKMLDYAESLEFEKAAELRDQVRLLEEQLLRLT